MRRLIAACVLLIGCGSEAFNALPEREQNRWQRCSNIIMSAQCGPDGTSMYRAMCGNRLANQYTERPNEEQRQQWLIENGCPETMVGRRAAMSSGGSASPP